jgi:hypothetical protein
MEAAEPDPLGWWLDLAGFFGILVLAVPAWSLNLRQKNLQRIVDIIDTRGGAQSPATVVDEVAEELRKRREAAANRWRRADEICLVIGYVLLLGSAALRAFA